MYKEKSNFKTRVQSYRHLGIWKGKAMGYLKKQEGFNNIFWQVIRSCEQTSQKVWAGNLFSEGKIILSAMHTPSGFLLLSHGSCTGVHALAKYAIRQKWRFKGVSGPECLVQQFLDLTNRAKHSLEVVGTRKFKIFQSCFTERQDPEKIETSPEFQLGEVKEIDWPRARTWSQKFALESDPPLDVLAIMQMSKKMYSENNLFTLSDSENNPCAMAGFGRTTDRYRVINMVYVPYEFRRQGVARELIRQMTKLARDQGHADCLLFSDWLGEHNLYESIGFKCLGIFIECDLA